jgi:FAD/FMN-containing dehydrogenase
MDTDRYLSWGRVQRFRHRVHRLDWLTGDALACLQRDPGSMLPFGLGRSYGDVCLNDGGALLDTSPLTRLIAFDPKTGLLRCEAGLSIADLLRFAVPRGFFVPVTPGTKYVTLGGAIANDVHGKNHHGAGTFGRHVPRFELARSDGSRLECSREKNAELYRATIGGLGLTGLITWVEVQLKPIESSRIDVESIRFESLEEFLEIEHDSALRCEYTVAWVDTLHRGGVRGLYMRGAHAAGSARGDLRVPRDSKLMVPFDAPEILLGSASMKAFNELYYRKQLARMKATRQSYEPFFYPLDAVLAWNRLYGRRGFFQFQCAIPHDRVETLKAILDRISASQNGSFLAVLKTFGELASPGLMSFPRPGLTLTLDFASRGERTTRLLAELDELTRTAGGRLYPAKDSTMSRESFVQGYPEARELARYVDPKFSSSFWRRVT